MIVTIDNGGPNGSEVVLIKEDLGGVVLHMLPPSARRLPDKGRARVRTSNSAKMALFSMSRL